MVIGMLAAMLILSGALSIGAVQPVLGYFLLLAVLFLVHLTACMVPGYVRMRAACSTTRTTSRAHQPTGTPVLRSGAKHPALRQNVAMTPWWHLPS
jgi:hypothetical protein